MALDASLSLRDEGLSACRQHHVRQGAPQFFLRAVRDVAIRSYRISQFPDRPQASSRVVETGLHMKPRHFGAVFVMPFALRVELIEARNFHLPTLLPDDEAV